MVIPVSNNASFTVTEDSPPISQNVMAGSLLSGSATYLIIDVNELNRVAITIPISTNAKVVLLPLDIILLNMNVMATADKPNINEETCMPTVPNDNRMAIAAPNPYPADAPRISGETIGFLNNP